MRITYAVTWQEPDGVRHSGRLELGVDALRLEGGNGQKPFTSVVPYAGLAAVRLARSSGDRLQGRPTVVLELGSGELKIASVAQPGIVRELAERLAGFTEKAAAAERAALIVPLRKGAKAEAEALLREGPPFDPSELGLESHDVYVTDDAVVFVFQGVPSVFVERLAADESIWDAAEAWKPLIAGRIRYADQAYGWAA